MIPEYAPDLAATERARQLLKAHQPQVFPEKGKARGRPCLTCGDPWPCQTWREAGLAYDNGTRLYEVAPVLPDLFADRLPPEEVEDIREYAEVGEWSYAVDLLLASLHYADADITDDERRLLGTLMNVMRISAVLLPGSDPAFRGILSNLVDRFDGRQPPRYQGSVRAHIDAARWTAALRLLLQHLREVGTPVTEDDWEVLRTLVIALRLPFRLTKDLHWAPVGDAS
ncbi:MAG: MafI family immunity protein [Micromonosporaceae bacterium]